MQSSVSAAIYDSSTPAEEHRNNNAQSGNELNGEGKIIIRLVIKPAHEQI